MVLLIMLMIVLDQVTVDSGIEIIEEISKVMAGFIGLIIGFYFGTAGRSSSPNAGPCDGIERSESGPVDASNTSSTST